MFIAHLPSGYLLAIALMKRVSRFPASAPVIMLWAIFGALAPDFDMGYFYLVDNRQTHHHRYPTHWPLVWLALCTAAWLWRRAAPCSTNAALTWVFGLGGVLHLILDSLVGDIWWLAPLVDQPYALFSVPAGLKPWWLNFLLHWSFAVELAITAWALLLYQRRWRDARAATSAERFAHPSGVLPMSWLELRVPPLALLLGFAALALGLARWLPELRLAIPGAPLLALVLALAGGLVALLGVLAFRRARTTVNPTQPGSASAMVASGVYRLSRNPMYLGFAAILLAVALWLSHALALALVPVFVLYLNRFQIVPEERYLASKFGEAFTDYRLKVRRWL